MRSIADIFRSYAEFDASGRHVNGTDKQSNHNYGDAYEWIIHEVFRKQKSDLKSEVRNSIGIMMEIGVSDGSSLLAWREVFPNALCVGLDIHPSAKAHGERIEFHLGDQRSREDCLRAAAGRQFDFICEDATHHIEDTLVTLFWLWPHVRPGGIYVVEEWDGGAGDVGRITGLFPFAEVVETKGPFGGVEPLVVLRKPK